MQMIFSKQLFGANDSLNIISKDIPFYRNGAYATITSFPLSSIVFANFASFLPQIDFF